jgi:rhamnosyltransferase
MEKNIFNCIFVIYNLDIKISVSLKSVTKAIIPKDFGLKIWVCDNTVKQWIKDENKVVCNNRNWAYFDMGGNLGLSKAYNRALAEIPENEWVVLFDQDTLIPENFFVELLKSIKKYPSILMHVPYVESLGKRISPSVIYGHVIRNGKKIKYGENNEITAINSGMAMHKSIFSKTGLYDERFFLDCIDHHFVKLYKKSGGKIAVFNCKLEQAFSGDDHSDWEKDYCRFLIYKKDFYLFCRDSFSGKTYYFLKIVLRALRLSLIYKNFAFIRGVFCTCPK